MAQLTNPIILSVAGDKIIGRIRVLALIWVGTSTAGDTAKLNGGEFWEGVSDGSHVYEGISFAPHGMPTGGTLELTQISNSTTKLFVYIMEA